MNIEPCNVNRNSLCGNAKETKPNHNNILMTVEKSMILLYLQLFNKITKF